MLAQGICWETQGMGKGPQSIRLRAFWMRTPMQIFLFSAGGWLPGRKGSADLRIKKVRRMEVGRGNDKTNQIFSVRCPQLLCFLEAGKFRLLCRRICRYVKKKIWIDMFDTKESSWHFAGRLFRISFSYKSIPKVRLIPMWVFYNIVGKRV